MGQLEFLSDTFDQQATEILLDDKAICNKKT